MPASSRAGRGMLFPGFGRGLGGLLVEPVERTEGGADELGRYRRITRRGFDQAMAQQDLDDAHIRAVLQQMRGEAVPERMDGHSLAQAAALPGVAAGLLQRVGVEMLAVG